LRGKVYICHRHPSNICFVTVERDCDDIILLPLIGITANVGTETKEVVLDRKASIFPEWDKELLLLLFSPKIILKLLPSLSAVNLAL
jgi:hypothetical protein